MARYVYEGLYILDSGRFARDPEDVSSHIQNLIQQSGGEILVSRLWEERRLAYPIKGHKKGVYWLTYFRLDGGELAGLRRKCQLSDVILRVLFLRVDPRIVDALVEHAKAGPARPVSEPTEGKEKEAERRPREKVVAVPADELEEVAEEFEE